MIFKDHLLQAQEQSIAISRKSGENVRRVELINKEVLAKLKT